MAGASLSSSAYVEEWLVGPRSMNFYTRTYASSSPSALLVFIHGAAEHAGRYTEMHTNLATQHGIAVFVFDLRGFGRTALDKEHKSKSAVYGKTDWTSQMDDMEWAIQSAGEKIEGVPIFLMGTSMGGGLVLGLLCDEARAEHEAVKQVVGVIAGSPCITLTNPVPKPLLWVARKVGAMTPTTIYPIRNRPEDLSRNPDTNASYVRDPLIRTPGTLQSLGDMIGGGEWLLNTGYNYWPEGVSVLFLHGTSDNVTSRENAELLYRKLPANDKMMMLYPDARHELHNEPDGVKEKSLLDIAEFIRSRILV